MSNKFWLTYSYPQGHPDWGDHEENIRHGGEQTARRAYASVIANGASDASLYIMDPESNAILVEEYTTTKVGVVK